MPFTPVLLSLPNKFSNYTSYYELFAGMSSALAGIETLRFYITSRLSQVLDILRAQIVETNDLCNTHITELINVLSGSPELLQNGGRPKLQKLLKSQDWLQEVEGEVSTEGEDKVVNNLAIAVFMCVLYSCIFLLVMAGLQADTVISDATTFAIIANYELAWIFSFAVISWLICEKRFFLEKPVRTSTIAFAISASISAFYPSAYTFLPAPNSLVLVVASLALCICPMMILLVRGVLYLPYFKLKKIQKTLDDIVTENDNTSNWLLEQAIPLDI